MRDWLYVEDHCLGLELILAKGKVGETYNIGGGAEWTTGSKYVNRRPTLGLTHF